MYKNNSRDSSKIKDCSPLQLSSNLTRKYYAIGYYPYTHRSYSLPGGVALIAFWYIHPSIENITQLVSEISEIEFGLGIFLIFVAYIVGNAVLPQLEGTDQEVNFKKKLREMGWLE